MKFLKLLAVIAVIIGWFSLLYGLSKIAGQPKSQPVLSGTFHMKYGAAVCGNYYLTECGIHLTKCDGLINEYHCMHDVSMDLDVKAK